MGIDIAFRRLFVTLLLLTAIVTSFSIAVESQHEEIQEPVYQDQDQDVLNLPLPPESLKPHTRLPQGLPTDSPVSTSPTLTPTEANVLHDLHNSLSIMQDQYFSLWLGKWTSAIDWTGAVIGTYISATLSSLSRSIDYTMPSTFDKSRKLDVEAQIVENEINKYFAQSTSYYFGEDHFAIRMQAFDDMLWVVLGWLEAANFVSAHSTTHYAPGTGFEDESRRGTGEWHARQFIPAFAHRARIFYELAEKGWDWRLCGGGMTWNPRLLPYKNAITNQLFISASIAMYLYFPGDENCSPFISRYDDDCDATSRGRYDPAYRSSAINGYEWLKNVGMMNEQGLYVDGFHIGGYRTNHSKTMCDERNEMVYTYNQGVVLSGLRGLWEATGNITYLEDGHDLVRNVINATGWTKTDILSSPPFTTQQPPRTRINDHDTPNAKLASLTSSWNGLGTNGILTELCDPSARCSQDSQTFKGIFFHHLTSFCTPLPLRPVAPSRTYAATREIHALHRNSCNEYAPWVVHNAQAALQTRDEKGRFGSWWGAPDTSLRFPSASDVQSFQKPSARPRDSRATTEETNRAKKSVVVVLPHGAVDYRNTPTASDGTYILADNDDDDDTITSESESDWYNNVRGEVVVDEEIAEGDGDLNDRGRGRTLETQGSGLAVVRAMWEFLRHVKGEERAF
ncbi:Nn.00g009720.m01.CDS01 [Neocucurbitaria sp. VM-36]